MDILSLTHNVRVGQEVEPGGIKTPERNFGKEVRKTGSPPTRGAPSEIRADRKEASQIEPKPLQQALDLLEAELPIDSNFRDLALNKKIRPGIGLGKVLSGLDLNVESGKPKIKDLLAAIGVDVPATLTSRNLTVLQHAIAEKTDGLAVPIPLRHLIDTLLRTGNVPVAQAYEIGEVAPDGRIPSVDSGDRPRIIRSEEPPKPVTGINLRMWPRVSAPPQPKTQVNAGDDAVRSSVALPRTFGVFGMPRPIGIKEVAFIEIPRPGVPSDMFRMPIKIAPELGAHKIEVQAELPPVNLETMAGILNKRLSPVALRGSITAQAPVPRIDAASPVVSMLTPRVRGSEPQREVVTHLARPVPSADGGVRIAPDAGRPTSSNAVPRTAAHPIPEAIAPGTLTTPDSYVGRRPRLDNSPVPSVSNRVPSASSAQPLTAAGPKPIGLDGGVPKAAWPDFEVPSIRAIDLEVPLASSILDGVRRTQDGSAIRLAAQQVVSSVHDSIVDHIQEIAASQGRGRVVIRLQPEDLGSITVSVRSFGQRVEADIRASNDAVRDALVANRGDLVQSVESKGLSLDSFNVGQEADGEPQTSDQRADRNNDMRREFERFANLSQASRKDVPVTAAPWFAPSTEAVDYTV